MDIAEAVRIIKRGGVVAFPTETVYGLGANALDASAVGKIYAAKGRPADNPCIVHVSDEKMLHDVAKRIPRAARALMTEFWPGPLTIILKKSAKIPDAVTGGLSTVAVRMPDHPVALALIRATGPIAAPSANKSGRPSPTTAAHVRRDLSVPVLDGGPCRHGIESTVVSLAGKPEVLRLGAIPLERLRNALPGIVVRKGTSARPESPGMKYRHYAPDKPLLLFHSIDGMARYAKAHPRAVALCLDRHLGKFKSAVSLGKNLEEMARNLFGALRTARGSELLVHAVPKRGHGRAIMDRLEKAATQR